MRAVETAIGRRARRLISFSIKIVLALSVLAHFITAVMLSARRKLKSRHFKLIQVGVFCHVVPIVFLTKAMFYIAW